MQGENGDIPVKFYITNATTGLKSRMSVSGTVKTVKFKFQLLPYTYSASEGANILSTKHEYCNLFRNSWDTIYERYGSGCDKGFSQCYGALTEVTFTDGVPAFSNYVYVLGKCDATWRFYISEYEAFDADGNSIGHIKADISGHWKDMVTGELLPNYRDGEITDELFEVEVIEE